MASLVAYLNWHQAQCVPNMLWAVYSAFLWLYQDFSNGLISFVSKLLFHWDWGNCNITSVVLMNQSQNVWVASTGIKPQQNITRRGISAYLGEYDHIIITKWHILWIETFVRFWSKQWSLILKTQGYGIETIDRVSAKRDDIKI